MRKCILKWSGTSLAQITLNSSMPILHHQNKEHKHHLNITENSMQWAYPHQVSVRWETRTICEAVPVAFHGVSTSGCWLQAQCLRLLLRHWRVHTVSHIGKSLCHGRSAFGILAQQERDVLTWGRKLPGVCLVGHSTRMGTSMSPWGIVECSFG